MSSSSMAGTLALLLLMVGCSSEGGDQQAEGERPALTPASPSFQEPLRLEDDAGRRLVLDRPPRRVISLIPSASLVLRALGEEGVLVGRTDFDTAAVFQDLPSVGGGLHPNLEAIVTLEPELVIRFAGDSDPATHTRLEEFGIPHLALRPDGIQDIRRSISILGAVMGREAAADSILYEMDSTLAEIRAWVGDLPPMRVAFLLGGTPPWVAGPGSYIDELLEVAGGANAFSDLSALYGPVNLEAFLAREIDLILAPEGAELGIPDLRIPVARVNPSLEIPGPELASHARSLVRILHPEVFQ